MKSDYGIQIMCNQLLPKTDSVTEVMSYIKVNDE